MKQPWLPRTRRKAQSGQYPRIQPKASGTDTLRQKLQDLAGGAFALGILLFSGSLYLLTLSGISALGMITPIGGLSFLAGWLCLGLAVWRMGAGKSA